MAALLALAAACSEDEPGTGGQGGGDVSEDINRVRPEPDAAGDGGPNDVATDGQPDGQDAAGEDPTTGDADIEVAEDDPVVDTTADGVGEDVSEADADAGEDLPVEDLPEGDGPLPPVAVAGDDFSGRAAVPVSFDASASFDPDGTVTTWTWTFGDGSEDAGETVFHTYANPGVYIAELTVGDDDGLTDKDTVTVNIGAENEPPVAVIEGPHDVVQDEPASFDGRDSSDDGTIESHAWDVDVSGVDPLAGSTLEYTWLDWGDYTLVLTVEDDLGATDTVEHEVAVLARPVALIDAVTSTTVGTEIAFDGSDSTDEDGTVVEWLWEFPDDSTQTTPMATFTFTEAGEPEVFLTVTDNDGLTSTASHKIGVTGGGSTDDLTGIWELDPDPDSGESWSDVSYACGCFGFVCLVDFTFAAVEIQQTGSNSLAACQAPPGMPCTVQPGRMTGTLEEDGTFEVSRLFPGGPGGCDEIYSIEAVLEEADEFRGFFTAEFSGGACAAAECFTQEWAVRGLRVSP